MRNISLKLFLIWTSCSGGELKTNSSMSIRDVIVTAKTRGPEGPEALT